MGSIAAGPVSGAELGVVDALVFRRIGTSQWAHVGGIGRGEGWAGIIDVDENADELTVRIPSQIGAVHRHDSATPGPVLGPYYATSSAIVRVSRDVAVVLGNPHEPLAIADDVTLLTFAQHLDSEILDVTPARRLADELQMLTCVRALFDTAAEAGLHDMLTHLLRVVAEALACDAGFLRTGDGVIATVGNGTVDDDDMAPVFDEVESTLAGEMWCAQDMASCPSSLLTQAIPEAYAVLAAPLAAPIGGSVIFVHTRANPRSFSQRCQRLLHTVLDTGMVMARTAAMRDELRAAADTATAAARTDPLTGLGNRLAWDEAIGRAQEAVDRGVAYSLVSIDVDGLKEINDRYGHTVGDQLLRQGADIIRKHCSPDDLAVRMGGDEFAILVPHALCTTDPTFVAFAAEFAGLSSTADSVAASLGVCTVTPGGSLFDALREADMQMYAQKRLRRRNRAAQEYEATTTHYSGA